MKGQLKGALYYGGVLAVLRHWRPGRALIVRYHAIAGAGEAIEHYAAPGICLPAEAFAHQAAFLARAYRVVPLAEIVEAVRAGRPLPARAVAITFDDGYADNYRHAFPVLRRLGLPATIFITTAAGPTPDGPLATPWMARLRGLVMRSRESRVAVDGLGEIALGDAAARERAARQLTRALVPLPRRRREDAITVIAAALKAAPADVPADVMLSWSQAREMAAAGIEIAAHTVYHGNLPLAPPEEAREEIAGSKAAIEAALGTPVRHFAYTNTGNEEPHTSPAVTDLVRAAGFRGAVSPRPGAVDQGSDPFALARLGVSPRLAPLPALAAAAERHRLLGRRAA